MSQFQNRNEKTQKNAFHLYFFYHIKTTKCSKSNNKPFISLFSF